MGERVGGGGGGCGGDGGLFVVGFEVGVEECGGVSEAGHGLCLDNVVWGRR